MLREKIKAALIGGAIGDAWGKPVETWNPERIDHVHPGGVHGYVPPIGHKWFKAEEHPPGTTTDDTQLHVATMVGLMTARKMGATSWEQYMDEVAKAHLDSMRITTAGAGDSTKLSILSLAEGKTWSNSGLSGLNQKGQQMGTGNGVPMRIGALSAFYVTPVGQEIITDFDQACVDFSSMTHATRISAEASIAHARAVAYCLKSNATEFQPSEFLRTVQFGARRWEDEFGQPPVGTVAYRISQLQDVADKMTTAFQQLEGFNDIGDGEFVTKARQTFGSGSCYLYHSMPFTYAFFLRHWSSMAALDEVINAGGDTDTNGKMVGEMLGALHGMGIFKQPEWQWTLIGLLDRKLLEQLADDFCDTMGVE